ncbi:iron complex outermembrane receptor protein [Arcticibacter tournemirensis]|uniref:TonB-dependent receptor n=1 Tax=Arcticibacter tournemirensis TaxID=699437 RepID=A0A5M9HBM1_9SPHI|nr:TonB-dependent receptor [Arcticibacter tournemirensis]KAA8484356.1 TonB-dependent receptor [Arcticibacter tournemirensis]TQM49793.1 iron complex outermembrane receptor protein [Arcticibacter tournemirensis]
MKKHYMKSVFLLLSLVLFSIQGFSQTGSISGQVVDEKGQPLPGASVSIKNINRGTSTDEKGVFRLNAVANGSYVLTVSFIGYQVLETQVTVNGEKRVALKLVPNAQNLTEVVVIGYGTQRRKEVTGSISTVSSKDFQKGNITTPEQLIVGKVAGVQVTTNGGQPGSGSTIRIRGGASLNASNDPLIVIDGVPVSNATIPGVSNPLAMINPNDIETFTVLKDANATAIYGSRASNGVILITTKKGKSGAPSINFSSQNSIATVAKKVDVLTADEVRTYVNANGSDALKALLGTANTDWQDEVFRNAATTDNNLSISGTSKNMPYRVSFGYLNQNGTLITDKLERGTAGLSLNPRFLDNHLKVDFNVKNSLAISQFANQDAISGAVQFNPTWAVNSANSTYGGYFEWLRPDGTLNPNAPRNPVGAVRLKDDSGNTMRSFGNLQLDYSFHFLPELHANVNVGYDVSRGKGIVYIPAEAAISFSTRGNYNRYKSTISNNVVEAYLNYNKDISSINSNINATAGYGYYANRTKNYNFASYEADGKTVKSTPKFPFDIPENRLLSYYGRLIYTLNNRYIFSGTVRTDGSSRFSEDNRWGVFPSAAFTWRINEEGFLKGTNALSDLKLRLSYGVTGQQEGIANYSYLSNYSVSNNEAMYQIGDTYYYMNAPVAYDEDIKWETTETYNAGIDYGFLNGRINGSIDVYRKKTKDLLSVIPIPIGSNFSNQLLTNVGNMEADGVELAINAKPILKKDFSWDLGFNFTYNKTKVTNLTASYNPDYMVSVGDITGSTGNKIQAHALNRSPFSYYVWKQVYDESGKPLSGVYADLDGDGTITEADKYFYKSPLPKYSLGFSTSVSLRKWTLSTVLRSNIGNYIYDNVSSNLSSRTVILDATSGVVNNVVRDFLNTGFSANQYYSDYYVKNASFLKMDNLGLAYDAGNIARNGKMNLTISANVQNVFVISDYEGVDPENNKGIDYKFYPRPRTYVLGLNVGF